MIARETGFIMSEKPANIPNIWEDMRLNLPVFYLGDVSLYPEGTSYEKFFSTIKNNLPAWQNLVTCHLVIARTIPLGVHL